MSAPQSVHQRPADGADSAPHTVTVTGHEYNGGAARLTGDRRAVHRSRTRQPATLDTAATSTDPGPDNRLHSTQPLRPPVPDQTAGTEPLLRGSATLGRQPTRQLRGDRSPDLPAALKDGAIRPGP